MSEIAILLPAYNASKFLPECLDSILNQTYTNFQLIICDDCSTDNTSEILKDYASRDSRITVLTNQSNQGIAKTRNRLLHAMDSHTKFVVLMDSDDVCLSDRLQRQRDFLIGHPGISAVGSALEIIDENSNVVALRHYPTTCTQIRRTILKSNPFAQPSLMLRQSIFEKIGDYREDLIVCEDYDYWLRALLKFDFANLSKPVIRYRISTTQSKTTQLKATLRNTLLLQRQYLFCQRYRSFGAIVQYILKHLLLWLPDSLIMALFKLMTYKNSEK